MKGRAAGGSIPLWRSADQVAVRMLVEDYEQQLYLLSLAGPSVLIEAPRSSVATLT